MMRLNKETVSKTFSSRDILHIGIKDIFAVSGLDERLALLDDKIDNLRVRDNPKQGKRKKDLSNESNIFEDQFDF